MKAYKAAEPRKSVEIAQLIEEQRRIYESS